MNFKKWVKSIQTAGYNGAHTVLVLINGEIIQRGNHQILLEAGGLYKELCDQQAKVVESASISKETMINNSGDNDGADEK